MKKSKSFIFILISLSLIVATSCNRPDRHEKTNVVPPMSDGGDPSDSEESIPFPEIITEEMKPYYLKDMAELDADKMQVAVKIVSKVKLRKVTSNAWRTDTRAHNGQVVKISRDDLDVNSNYCHFVDKTPDTQGSKAGSAYSVFEVETKANDNGTIRYHLHLASPKYPRSLFIICRAKVGAAFTAIDLMKTFGSDLGISFSIREKATE